MSSAIDPVVRRPANLRVVAAGSALVLLVVAYSHFVVPRPYEVLYPVDNEQAGYYAARLIHEGRTLPIASPYSPGWWVAAAALTLSGSDIQSTQAWAEISHLLVALCLSATLVLFWFLCLRKVAVGTAVVSTALVLAWPTVATYVHSFCAYYSFTPIFGLCAVSLLWKSFEGDKPRIGLLFASAAAGGVCLANSPVQIPLVFSLIAGAVARGAPRSGSIPERVAGLARVAGAVFAGVVLGYLALASLDFRAIVPVMLEVAGRHDARLGLNAAAALARAVAEVVRFNPLFGVFACWTVGAFGAALLRRPAAGEPATGGMDHAAARVFLVTLGLCFLYTLAATMPDTGLMEPTPLAVRLRFSSSTMLVLPFMALYAEAAARRRGAGRGERWLAAARVSWALCTLAFGIVHDLQRRDDLVGRAGERIRVTAGELLRVASPGTRVAVWDGTPAVGYGIGRPGFHYFGNARFAASHFETELRAAFPQFDYLNLRSARRLLDGSSATQGGRLRLRWYGWVGQPWWAKERPPGVLLDASKGDDVSLVAFPRSEMATELPGVEDSELLRLLGPPWTGAQPRSRMLGDSEWVVVSRNPESAGPRDR